MELTTRAAVDKLSAISFPTDERAVAATLAAARSSRLLVRTFADVFLNPAPRPIPQKARGNRRPSTFTQRDLARAIRGVKMAGEKVTNIKIDYDGSIRVAIAGTDPETDDKPMSDLDVWLTRR